MAFKKNNKFRQKKRKIMIKYSYTQRREFYRKKEYNGKSSKERDYATGYLDGMQGVISNICETKSCESGNKAGLKFWNKMVNTKI